MTVVNLATSATPTPSLSTERTTKIGLGFGIPLVNTEIEILPTIKIDINPGEIILIVGESGCGKSTAIRKINEVLGGLAIDEITFDPDSAVIEGILPGRPLEEAILLVTKCGFTEPKLWLRRFDELSDGEQFRIRLAKAVSLSIESQTYIPLLCDEFGSRLHRQLLKAICYNLRSLVATYNLTVVATIHDDGISKILNPTVIVRPGQSDSVEDRREFLPFPTEPINDLRFLVGKINIEKGSRRDYAQFSQSHYRQSKELGFVDCVYTMYDGNDKCIGVIVYSYGALALALRNKATNRRFSRKPKQLNEELRVIRRVVVHPDLRGCGLGHFLVSKTMPLVGVEFIECLASMGRYNPVFEKAGMTKIGEYRLSAQQQRYVRDLRALEANPLGKNFIERIREDSRVWYLVKGAIFDWYRGTTGGGVVRVEKQSPELLAQIFLGLVYSTPTYYLWRRSGAPFDQE